MRLVLLCAKGVCSHAPSHSECCGVPMVCSATVISPIHMLLRADVIFSHYLQPPYPVIPLRADRVFSHSKCCCVRTVSSAIVNAVCVQIVSSTLANAALCVCAVLSSSSAPAKAEGSAALALAEMLSCADRTFSQLFNHSESCCLQIVSAAIANVAVCKYCLQLWQMLQIVSMASVFNHGTCSVCR